METPAELGTPLTRLGAALDAGSEAVFLCQGEVLQFALILNDGQDGPPDDGVSNDLIAQVDGGREWRAPASAVRLSPGSIGYLYTVDEILGIVDAIAAGASVTIGLEDKATGERASWTTDTAAAALDAPAFKDICVRQYAAAVAERYAAEDEPAPLPATWGVMLGTASDGSLIFMLNARNTLDDGTLSVMCTEKEHSLSLSFISSDPSGFPARPGEAVALDLVLDELRLAMVVDVSEDAESRMLFGGGSSLNDLLGAMRAGPVSMRLSMRNQVTGAVYERAFRTDNVGEQSESLVSACLNGLGG